jgi:hypothetical protein
MKNNKNKSENEGVIPQQIGRRFCGKNQEALESFKVAVEIASKKLKEDLITDTAIELTFQNADFGKGFDKRKLVEVTLLQVYKQEVIPFTISKIMQELGLISKKPYLPNEYWFTPVGLAYLEIVKE